MEFPLANLWRPAITDADEREGGFFSADSSAEKVAQKSFVLYQMHNNSFKADFYSYASVFIEQ